MIKFNDGASMHDIRTGTIHAIIDAVNAVESDVSDMVDEVADHEARLQVVEAAGPGEGGSGAPLTAAAVEGLIDDTLGNVDASVVGDKLVLTADVAEGGSSTFIGLTDTPAIYTAGGYLRVNEDATGVEFHNPNEGDEQAYVNSIQVYGEFYIPGTSVGGGEAGRTNLCSKATYTMFSSNVDYMVLPEIVSSSTIPTDGQVRTGLVLNFTTFNAPATLKKPVASTGQRIYANGGLVDELALATGENVALYAMYNGSKFKHWIAVGGRYSLPEVTDPLPDAVLESMVSEV